MIYLASVYSLNADKALMEQRYKFALMYATFFTKKGEPVFSPIVHSHPMSVEYDMPTDFDFWRELDYKYLSSSEALWVLMMDGWQDSKGVSAEIAYATLIGLPIKYIKVRGSPPASAWEEALAS